MLVKNWMSKPAITITMTSTMQQAVNLMMEHDIGILPVLDEGKLVGIVTDSDIRRVSPSDIRPMTFHQILFEISRVAVGAFMTRQVVTIPLDFTVEETAQVLLEKGFSGAPVVDAQGQVQGVITREDVFRVLIAVSGVTRRGVQFGLLLEDEKGKTDEINDLIRAHDVRIVSFMNSYELAPAGYFYVYIRISHPEKERLLRVIDELGRKNRMIYWVDHEENVRKIFD